MWETSLKKGSKGEQNFDVGLHEIMFLSYAPQGVGMVPCWNSDFVVSRHKPPCG